MADTKIDIIENPHKAEWVLEILHGKTYQEVEDYIEDNVTDFASAKVVMKKMAKIVLMLAKFIKLEED